MKSVSCRAQAKKRKLSGSSSHPDASEPEDPKLDAPETQVEPSDAGQGAHDDTPQPNEPVDVDIVITEASLEMDPKLPSPLPPTQEVPAQEEEVTITGSAYAAPAPSNVLTKHIHKGETPSPEKDRNKLDLPNLEKLTADELHSGYLSRLAASRDMEAKLVDMMKKKYEVFHFSALCIPLCSPQGLAYILENKPGLQ